ncbi:RLORF3 [Gallid alphaherpesvirus 2]|nr:RLORF3 [synthetic construct]ACF49523.1 RLORF3 [synthetic construct]AYC12066.1 RLORF3 [Gallid alphaherpesvirus 2]AYC12197.1 RLORF3 [Gallid alphaherpesvirus 2]
MTTPYFGQVIELAYLHNFSPPAVYTRWYHVNSDNRPQASRPISDFHALAPLVDSETLQ